MRFTSSFDDTSIAFEEYGRGWPAVVFVHGWACDHTYWRDQVKRFEPLMKVVTLDLAGHGGSGADRSTWTIASFGADVVAVVEALDLQHVVLVGHSMGGDVICEAGLRLGDRVEGLVWVDTHRTLGAQRTERQIARFLAPFVEDFPAATRRFARWAFLPDTEPE